jgi:Protein of unknown function (DUF3619)
MMEKNDRLIKNIRQVLDQSLDELDAVTQSKLSQARYLAIERQQQRKSRLLYWGAFPAVGLVLLVLLLNWPAAPINQGHVPDFVELSILTSTEPLEFYQEEIEFYEWLSEVLEAENELSLHTAPQFDSATDRFVGAGDQCARDAKPRNARLFGVI